MNAANSAGFEAWNESPGQTPKTSILAILSLILSILCITAPIGLICGIAALFTISASQGRKTGRGLAIGGIIVGLLGLVVWTFVAFAAVGANSMAQMMIKPIGEVMTQVEAKDYTKARAMLTTSSSAAITDADFDAFRTAYTTSTGSFQSMPQSMMSLFSAWGKLGPSIQILQRASANRGDMIPLPGEFANGTSLIGLYFDQNAGGPPGSPNTVSNIAVVGADGVVHWLKDPATLPASGSPKIKIEIPPAPPKPVTPATAPETDKDGK